MSWSFQFRGASLGRAFLLIALLLGPGAIQTVAAEQPVAYTTQWAMHLLYGNFDSTNGISRLYLRPAKEGLRQKFHGKLSASALLDAAYVDAGIPRHLLVTLAQPVGQPWECHGCSLLVGAAVFAKVGDGWALIASRLVLDEAGEFAKEPAATLQLLGPDFFGFRLEDNFSGGGTGTGLSFYAISGKEINRVFATATDSSFMREHCWPMSLAQAWQACVEYTGGVSLLPGADPEHYDIVLTRRVTRSVTQRIPRGTYLFRYQYTAGKYILKEPSPTKPVAYDSRH